MLIILNDAVVDEVNGPVMRCVGVRVNLRDTAVGGPTGVGNASGAFHRPGKNRFQIRNLSHGLVRVNNRPVINGDSRRVVPSVLQTSQAFNQDREGLLVPNVAKNAAHGITSQVKGLVANRALHALEHQVFYAKFGLA